MHVIHNATAWIICSGVQDLFLSYMMYFILDDAAAPDIVRDTNSGTVYAVLDVIKSDSSLNEVLD